MDLWSLPNVIEINHSNYDTCDCYPNLDATFLWALRCKRLSCNFFIELITKKMIIIYSLHILRIHKLKMYFFVHFSPNILLYIPKNFGII